MNISDKLTIIIPSKNEEKNISYLLESLLNQTIDKSAFSIIIADKSTDSTREIIKSYQDKLDISIIEGDLPAIARNNGAKLAQTNYILFIDADTVLKSRTLLQDSIDLMKRKNLEMLTCNYRCRKNFWADIWYRATNILTRLSKLNQSFATTIFLMFQREKFLSLGGFDENAKHCEDVLISQQIEPKFFEVINQTVETDDRRFVKEGYFGFIKMFFKNWLNRNNKEYFYKDIGYWN